jgi:hypothetical protein
MKEKALADLWLSRDEIQAKVIYTKSMLRTVVLPPHPQPLSQRARGARKTFKVPRPQGEGFRERKTPGFELDKAYVQPELEFEGGRWGCFETVYF